MFLRKTVFLLFTIFIFSCSSKKEASFSFVQMCDTQLGMGGYQHDVKTFKQAVAQINNLDVDFAVICGDLVNDAADSTYNDFLEIKSGFDIPCYVASGNHDVGNVPDATSLKYYREKVGKDYFDFKHKGYSFVVTNTQLWKVEVDKESDLHDNWVKETLNKQYKKNRPIFVIGHYPLFTESFDEEEHYFNFPFKKRKELLDIYTKSNVKAVLSGHTHKRIINSYKNIQLVSGETTSKNFDKRPMGFRLWEVSSDTLKHHFVPLDKIQQK